ncbi:MAG: hypothetical protein L3K26_09760, partial [Candidatus Hydrogenedentes bacterium]|nr:hypothetical protein [Candidatus Hydrogenedentota bacterium]
MVVERWLKPKMIMLCLGIVATQAGVNAYAEDADTPAPIPYILSTCIVSGEINECPIAGETLVTLSDPLVKVYENREVRFCCAACIRKFESDPAGYFKKIDEALIKEQTPYYPL